MNTIEIEEEINIINKMIIENQEKLTIPEITYFNYKISNKIAQKDFGKTFNKLNKSEINKFEYKSDLNKKNILFNKRDIKTTIYNIKDIIKNIVEQKRYIYLVSANEEYITDGFFLIKNYDFAKKVRDEFKNNINKYKVDKKVFSELEKKEHIKEQIPNYNSVISISESNLLENLYETNYTLLLTDANEIKLIGLGNNFYILYNDNYELVIVYSSFINLFKDVFGSNLSFKRKNYTILVFNNNKENKPIGAVMPYRIADLSEQEDLIKLIDYLKQYPKNKDKFDAIDDLTKNKKQFEDLLEEYKTEKSKQKKEKIKNNLIEISKLNDKMLNNIRNKYPELKENINRVMNY